MRYKILFTFLIIFLPLPVYYIFGSLIISPLALFVMFFALVGKTLAEIINPLHSSFQSLEYTIMFISALFALISLTLQILLINFSVNYIKKIFDKNFTNIVQNILMGLIIVFFLGILLYIPIYSINYNEGFSLFDFLKDGYSFILE